MMTIEAQYYLKILQITQDYLGPAAERFISRQISSHFNKHPNDLSKQDIPMLAIRIRSGLKVLTHDEHILDEAYQRISAIGDA
jgi:hypothetical protein